MAEELGQDGKTAAKESTGYLGNPAIYAIRSLANKEQETLHTSKDTLRSIDT